MSEIIDNRLDTHLQSRAKRMAQLKKWMFLLVAIVSGVTELVGDGFSHDLSNNMASVA
jgi:hypothetical protein